jgi:hypothetical protein
MITSEQHQALYWQVRAAILGRHFAAGRSSRANLMALDNTLRQVPPVPAEPDDPADLVARWDVQSAKRENPLEWSARLLAAIAAEHALGNPNAQVIAAAALDSIELLYRRHGTGHFDGYIIRWDPVTSERWRDGAISAAAEFLVAAGEADYLYCVPHQDPRHVAKRAPATLSRLMTPAQQSEYSANADDYFDYRRWECSMDELSGLVAAYSALFELVPVPAVRTRVVSQVGRLADYLAEHAYLLVRPEGGLNYRGATGLLPALETPFNRVFTRVTGTSFPARTDFVGAMQQAGYWRLLEVPVDREAVAVVAAGLIGAPLLTAWLASNGPVAGLVGAALTGATATAGVVVPASIKAATPAILAALPRAVGLQVHSDTFDVDETDEPALAYLLSGIPADLRFQACADMSTLLPPSAGSNARGFLPHVGLSAIGDPDPAIGQAYLRLMRQHAQNPPPPAALPDPLGGCYPSAVALLLGADQAEEERLAELLAASHDTLAPGGFGLTLDQGVELILPGLDYLAGLSLAWLYAQRRAGQGNPVTTPGFPEPPAGNWPDVVVPGVVVDCLPGVAQAVGAAPGGGDFDLFAAGAPTARPAMAPLTVPPAAGHVVVDHVIVPVQDTDGDVLSDIVLQPGDEFEVTVTGTITAPEFLAQPSDANGWYVVDDATFPLHSGIDPDSARKYALLGRLGGYFFIGVARGRQRFIYHRSLPLYLRINIDDQTRGAGNGAFAAEITAWGTPRLLAEFVSLSVSRQMVAGSAQHITVAVRNRGSAWDPARAFSLVPTPGQSDAVWAPVPVSMTAPVGPRGTANFGIDITAPAAPGSYRMSWTLVTGGQALASTGPAAVIQVVSAQCANLQAQITGLLADIRELQADLVHAAPIDKAAIAGQLAADRAMLTQARTKAQQLGC